MKVQCEAACENKPKCQKCRHAQPHQPSNGCDRPETVAACKGNEDMRADLVRCRRVEA